jgi:hypothetical protein
MWGEENGPVFVIVALAAMSMEAACEAARGSPAAVMEELI